MPGLQGHRLRPRHHAGGLPGLQGHRLRRVRPHELFRREGTSVLCEAPITFSQAVLGAELEIPTIDGKVKYTLPEGTQSGTTFRLKGKGIPSLNGRGRGDQYVTVFYRDAPEPEQGAEGRHEEIRRNPRGEQL
jgi:molecular chaperone DnaJ